jgi:hypothetical protein
MLAGLAMTMSSVTVVGNSILLGRYKPRFAPAKPRKKELFPNPNGAFNIDFRCQF